MSTESIVAEIEKRKSSEGAAENDGKSLLYVTKVNIKDGSNVAANESEKLFTTLLKNDIIEQPIYNTESLLSKLSELRANWVDLNLFAKDDISIAVDLSSNSSEYETQINEIVDSSFAGAQEDHLHQRDIFNSSKPIPVELNISSKLSNFDSTSVKLSATASDKSPFTYQLSYLGKALNIQNNAVLNYSLFLKTSVLKESYNPTFQFNLDTKFIRQPNSKMYFQSTFGLVEQTSALKEMKLGFFKQLTKCSTLDLAFKTNFNHQLNMLLGYQQNLDKANKFVFNFDHNVLSLKNTWDVSVLSKINQSKFASVDNKLKVNDEKLSNNLTVRFGDSVFSAASVANDYAISSSELSTSVVLSAGLNASKKGPFFEVGLKQSVDKPFDPQQGFFYNIAWQY